MTTQIAVRLPDELVEYLDGLVGKAGGSRASIVARALNLYRQDLRAESDAQILEDTGDYDDFDAMVQHGSIDA
jgi:metal-responsive CopG/Arc/MetJ family transcriptional regulator